jgi:hypothetical protein
MLLMKANAFSPVQIITAVCPVLPVCTKGQPSMKVATMVQVSCFEVFLHLSLAQASLDLRICFVLLELVSQAFIVLGRPALRWIRIERCSFRDG